jgi:hypothetical protein
LKEEDYGIDLLFGNIQASGIQRGGGGGSNPSHPKIPMAPQNRAKLTPVWKTVKIAEFRMPTPQDVQKKGYLYRKQLQEFFFCIHALD